MADTPFLRMEAITKTFPGVRALQDVTLAVRPGEIHALVGENGAGKSTLMNVLTGVFPPDGGQIFLRGEPVTIDSPGRAQELGISMIHQELSLIPYLTVGQNIFLGREPRRDRLPLLIDWPRLYREASQLLERLNLNVDPRADVQSLSIARQQMVEVAKALSLNADLIAMDEPTSSLTERETEVLFEVMDRLRADGVSIIFISHRLEEVFTICDRISVLRDGQMIGTAPVADLDREQVVQMMVGRELGEMYTSQHEPQPGLRLEVTDLTDGEELEGVSFTLHEGEILGVAGLVGAGRTALAETLFGIRPFTGGRVRLDGEGIHPRSASEAIRLGIGLVPEDRKQQGLFLNMAVRENIVMSDLAEMSTAGFIHFGEASRQAEEMVKRLDIRTPGLRQRVRNLSGGNQQKAIIARWLLLNPRVLILDEPTRGIDVGARAEIHTLMSQLAAQGVAILMISSDLPEVLGVSDRILVMREGRVAGLFDREEATQDRLMHAATTGRKQYVDD